MSTPAILAIFPSIYCRSSPCPQGYPNICLALFLFMLWIFATDNHHNTIAADYLAAVTTRFHRGTYFHNLTSSKMINANSSAGVQGTQSSCRGMGCPHA